MTFVETNPQYLTLKCIQQEVVRPYIPIPNSHSHKHYGNFHIIPIQGLQFSC